jgi:phosphohistidine phosphatase SixA
MKQLIVIRHALAGKRDATRWPNDDDRPLTAAGQKQFGKVARGLSYMIRRPDVLLTSSLRRSTQTATLLVKNAEFPSQLK